MADNTKENTQEKDLNDRADKHGIVFIENLYGAIKSHGIGRHEKKKRYNGGKTMQIRIETNKTRNKRYFLWIEENHRHRPHPA